MTQGPGAREEAGGLTAVPRIEDLRSSDGGYDEAQVRQAFEAFQRHVTQLQTQLRVFQAAGRSVEAQPSGHAVRMDALHLIRAAAEFADALEKDAQDAATRQIRRAESDITDKQREFKKQEMHIDQLTQDSERQRTEILKQARKEAREAVEKAERDASEQVQEAESRGTRLLEQARHQATELTNSARAEIDQSLAWARSEATEIINRAREAAEQLLGAAGLGGDSLEKVVETITGTAAERSSRPGSGSAEGRSSATRASGTPPAPPSGEQSAS
jgi:vacuolar-type H+-ATPase subunit H